MNNSKKQLLNLIEKIHQETEFECSINRSNKITITNRWTTKRMVKTQSAFIKWAKEELE